MKRNLLAVLAALIASTGLVSGFTSPARAVDTRTVVVLVNFTDDRSQPQTVAQVQKLMFDTRYPATRAYFRAITDNQLDLTGDVIGWVQAPFPHTACSWETLRSLPVDLSRYDRVVYSTNILCGDGSTPYIVNAGRETMTQGLRNLRHELGHSFGLLHATFNGDEYGDKWDAMGGAYTDSFAYYSTWHRHQMGYLNDVVTVTKSGTYNLGTAEKAPVAGWPRLLHIVRPGQTEDLWLEWRQPSAVWNEGLPANDPGFKGVLFRYAPDVPSGSNSTLVCANCAPVGPFWIQDAPLPRGSAWIDPATKVFYQTVTTAAKGATVAIQFPT